MNNRKPPTFNLIDEHWIPCIRADGRVDAVGLREALCQAHTLREVHGDTPPETAALLRLLLTLAHRIFPVRDKQDWQALWLRRDGFDATVIDEYFAEWRRRFDMFDAERPFLQAAHPKAPEKTLNNLMLHMASGGNATLFDHHTDDEALALEPAQATRALLTMHIFGMCGLSGIPGVNFTDAPCARGILFFPEGDSLFETLLLNMIGNAITSKYGSSNDEQNLPLWEQSNPLQHDREMPYGYLDYLTWPNRYIRLGYVETESGVRIDRMWWHPGLRLNNSVRDPFKCYVFPKDKKKEPYPRAFRSDRALWRDSEALLRLRSDNAEMPHTIEWLNSISEDVLPTSRTLRLLALGMATEPGQAKIHFLRAERMPLPLVYLRQDALVEKLAEEIQLSERSVQALNQGLRHMAGQYLKPDADEDSYRKDDGVNRLVKGWSASDQYWSRLDLHFAALMQGLADPSPQQRTKASDLWQTQIEDAARDAFSYAEDRLGDEMRAMRARALGHGVFERRLRWELSSQSESTAKKENNLDE